MKQIYWILASVSLFSLGSCSNRPQDAGTLQTVKIDTVASADERTFLQYPGKVKAAQDISLAFRVSGTIQKIYVEDGAPVRQGQLLAQLDPTDYQVQLDATEAEYRQIKADAERVMALYKDNGTTPSANDKAVYGLKQITAKYQHHKDQLEYTRLYAPFNGFIQKRLFEAHETIAAGMPVLSMISGGMPEVEINLPAAEYIRRRQFSNYHCTFDIYPGKTYPLKLISITPKANANQLYTVRLQLLAGKQPMPSPGMNTMVTIYCDKENSLRLSVPSGAVLQKDGKAHVFVYNPSDNKVSSREVTLLHLTSNGRSLISSEYLKPGEPVVASGVHHIKDGETVKPLTPAAQTNVGRLL
ncbi:efflux RND transporter periplasmic adaptor subunit [Bacteroides helcogenes]|uniref:Efflux transporter, RND family, MFP subunit n=1 Tax=Bacteroides helcogenes (strain ATCC 35417 / DSM 20613 / JCM 6297 / CCUG 15421 / P 36-108) TaxID=693979 RepID=E6SRH3_BACT6|nr:efflux RND transporter periplasmic adaptor subunit [Bacteroides helcogenes]ADV44076.1 efflux transporter, RND family, MFP subunit [Bacteroides helcogenes P 36-108]MDY5237898.1 efflux RND transporter periplasmic adaptor subunit [Bacteroides helcogenes]